MRDSDYQFIQTFLKKHAAISIDETKQYLVESRLQPLAKAEGLNSIEKLVTKLRFQSTRDLERKVVEAMTTNETSFYRDPNVYQAIESHLIPAIAERNRTTKQVRIWSAACSTGQEPYTLAMILDEHFAHKPGWQIEVVATDIDTMVLERAKQGVYGKLAVNRGLPAKKLIRYFSKKGTEWQVKDSLKKYITFGQMNLAQSWSVRGTFDLILMRNVLIYFDRDTKREILTRAQRLLTPEGSLMLGTAETTLSITDRYVRAKVGKAVVYRGTRAA